MSRLIHIEINCQGSGNTLVDIQLRKMGRPRGSCNKKGKQLTPTGFVNQPLSDVTNSHGRLSHILYLEFKFFI